MRFLALSVTIYSGEKNNSTGLAPASPARIRLLPNPQTAPSPNPKKACHLPKSIFCLMSSLAIASLLAGCGGSSGGHSTGGGGSTPTVVTYTFTGATPVAVATQIGSGAYTQAALNSGTLTLSIPHGETKFSVAYLCPASTGSTTPQNFEFFNQATIADGTSYSAYCFTPHTSTTITAPVQVNAEAFPNAEYVIVSGVYLPWTNAIMDFDANLEPGSQDVPIYVLKDFNSIDDYLAIKILRGQQGPGALNSGLPVVLGPNDKVTYQPISYQNIPAGYGVLSPFVEYETTAGASITLDVDGSPNQYLAMPSGAYQNGDYYLFISAAGPAGNQNPGDGNLAEVETLTSTGGPQNVSFPAPWPFSNPTASDLPTFDFSYSGFSGMSNVLNYASFYWYPSKTSFNEISISATANYLNGSTSLTVPDLSAQSGFLSQKGFSGTVNWTTEVVQSNLSGAKPTNGTVQYVTHTGTYTLP